MESWRTPGSNLESGLDFGGPGPRFWRVLGPFFQDFGPLGKFWPQFSEICGSSQRRAEISRSGWAAVSPPRGLSIRRPPKVVQGVLDHQPNRQKSKCQDQSQMANLKGQALDAGPGSYTPLFFSPQAPGDDRNPRPKIHLLRLVGPLGSIFCSSRACFKNDFEKT